MVDDYFRHEFGGKVNRSIVCARSGGETGRILGFSVKRKNFMTSIDLPD